MTEKQLESITKNLSEKLVETVKVTVNGKIDALHIKVDAHNERHEADMVEVRKHMQDVKPYLDGARGVKVLGDGAKLLAGWVGALGVLWIAFKGLIPFK